MLCGKGVRCRESEDARLSITNHCIAMMKSISGNKSV